MKLVNVFLQVISDVIYILRWKAQYNFSFDSEGFWTTLCIERDNDLHWDRGEFWTANILGNNIILECICGAPVNEAENGWVHPRHVNANDNNGGSRKRNRLRNRKSAFGCTRRRVNYAFDYAARVIYNGLWNAMWTKNHRERIFSYTEMQKPSTIVEPNTNIN